MNSFPLTMMRRQWRLRTIRLFCAAVALATAVTFCITLLGDRLEQLLEYQSKEILAADLALETTSELSEDQERFAQTILLERAETLRLRTMARNAGDGLMLVSLKAVSNNYPLRGALQIATHLFGPLEKVRNGPAHGEAWVQERVLHDLGLRIGDAIGIGETSFKITKIIVHEPDRGNNFYAFTPRVMIHLDDLSAAEIIGTGSRYKQRYLFAGDAAQLEKLQEGMEELLRENQKFIPLEEANRRLTSNLDKAYRFLHLAALIAILLGASAAALASFQYVNEMTKPYAILRCLGLHGQKLRNAILFPFICYALAALIAGLLLGTLAHRLILSSLGELIPNNLPPAGMAPLWLSVLTALIVASGFALPFLSRLWKVNALGFLRQDEQTQASMSLRLPAIYMTLGLMALAWIAVRNPLIGASIVGVLAGSLALSWHGLQKGSLALGKISERFSVPLRLATRMLIANRRMVILQTLAVAIAIFSLAFIHTLRDDLLSAWEAKIPDDAANMFAYNLFQDDLPTYGALLKKHGIQRSPMYPIVRGRLSNVNGMPIRDYVSKEAAADHDSLHRDLALTWTSDLPLENKIVEGVWHDGRLMDGEATVSIEQRLANKLDIHVGDELEFTVQTQKAKATVSSIRKVEWETFAPNFYMIFNAEALADLPITWMASMHVMPEQRALLPEFTRALPAVTFFDVDYLIEQIRHIISQVSGAVRMISWFILIASILVFLSIETILQRNRNYSSAVCKAMGAGKAQMQSIFRLQFLLIGLFAGVLAWIINQIIRYIVIVWFIESEYLTFNLYTTALCLIATPIAVYLAGHRSIQRCTRIAPTRLLSAGG
ncbi:MAG: ABC transporter permease [Candidatus Eutrophobiaceae bacterium]